jgi:hypothetical protein
MSTIPGRPLIDPPHRTDAGRWVTTGVLGVTLAGLTVLWIAQLRAQSSLDQGLREIENGALPSMVSAHDPRV